MTDDDKPKDPPAEPPRREPERPPERATRPPSREVFNDDPPDSNSPFKKSR
jgi:hypothetical protein